MAKWVDMNDIEDLINEELDGIRDLIHRKNRDYGNSLQESFIVFGSGNDPMAGIKARIDDKLNRIRTVGVCDNTMDTIDDLVGYLIHLKIMHKRMKKS